MMITYLVYSLVAYVLILLGIAVVSLILKERPAEIKPKGRRGILDFEVIGCGLLNKGSHFSLQVEVVELEQDNNWSRIWVDKASASGMGDGTSDALQLIPNWLGTSKIRWLDNQAKV